MERPQISARPESVCGNFCRHSSRLGLERPLSGSHLLQAFPAFRNIRTSPTSPRTTADLCLGAYWVSVRRALFHHGYPCLESTRGSGIKLIWKGHWHRHTNLHGFYERRWHHVTVSETGNGDADYENCSGSRGFRIVKNMILDNCLWSGSCKRSVMMDRKKGLLNSPRVAMAVLPIASIIIGVVAMSLSMRRRARVTPMRLAATVRGVIVVHVIDRWITGFFHKSSAWHRWRLCSASVGSYED